MLYNFCLFDAKLLFHIRCLSPCSLLMTIYLRPVHDSVSLLFLMAFSYQQKSVGSSCAILQKDSIFVIFKKLCFQNVHVSRLTYELIG